MIEKNIYILAPSDLLFLFSRCCHGFLNDAKNDVKNVFFLQPLENLGAILFYSLLNGENYTMWSRAMIKVLSAKN